MAQRRKLSDQQVRILARRAVDAVARAQDRAGVAAEALAAAPGSRIRQAILEASTSSPPQVTHAILSSALHSGDTGLANIAAELLGTLQGTPEGRELLADCLRGRDEGIRRRAVEALESFRAPELAELLSLALTDESDVVRRSAAGTFGIVIGTPSHPLRSTMVDALGNPSSQLARAVIANEDTQVRRQAAQALAFLKSDGVLPTLGLLLRDADEEVRQEAVLSMAAIGTPAAVQEMAGGLSDESYLVASTTLDMLAGAFGGTSPALLAHVEHALDHPVPDVRRHAVLMLNQFDPADARRALDKAIADEDFETSRSAAEILRTVDRDAPVEWVSGLLGQQVAGESARAVWEAGNMGLERGPEAGGSTARSAVVPVLEATLRTGASSDQIHALNELASLIDIGDSEAMQAALQAPDPSVRSRAADTFSYTRDAGLLVHIVTANSDPHVRRRAAEALLANPGGPADRAGLVSSRVTFAAARTMSPELFGTFMAALQDPDQDVRQYACEAVRECTRSVGFLPVQSTLAALERVAEDPSSPYVVQEDADEAADAIRDAGFSEPFALVAQEVLLWRGALAREAHGLQYAGAYTLGRTIGTEALDRWVSDYGLEAEREESLRQAATGRSALPADVARCLIAGLVADMATALGSLAHAARTLRMLAEPQQTDRLARWHEALSTGPKLEWGPYGEGDDPVRQVSRYRCLARLEAGAALEVVRACPSPDWLDAAASDEDDWVRLVAMALGAELGRQGVDLQALAALALARADEPAYAVPLGRAAVALLTSGHEGGAPLARSALRYGDAHARIALTRELVAVAQEGGVARLLAHELDEREPADVAGIYLALALRGGAGAFRPSLPSDEQVGSTEEKCALLAARAMENDPRAAGELSRMLRDGEGQERYLAASFLGLARVWTAVLIFSSTRDQDAPYPIRLACACALTTRGHPGSLGWFQRVADSLGGRDLALTLTYACEAVEGTIPLMLQCADVNVGRFV
jgi:HEAT repeat protein